MNVGRINGLSFGSIYRKEKFYGMSQDQKLNEIYDMIADVRMHQDYNSDVISENQYHIQNANQRAFSILADDSDSFNKKDLISGAFEDNRVSTLPRSGIGC